MNSFERTRCHPSLILEKLFQSIWFVLILGFTFLANIFESGEDVDDVVSTVEEVTRPVYAIPVAIGIFAAILLFLSLIFFFQWRKTYLYAHDDNLVIERGVMFKRKMVVPFDKINTVDVHRNLFQRLIGTCRLKVDTGAISANAQSEAEVNLVFSLKKADEIKDFILSRRAHDENILRKSGNNDIEEKGKIVPTYHAKFFDFFLYGLTQSKLVGMISVAFIFIPILLSILEQIGSSFISDILPSDFSAFLSFGIGAVAILLVIFLLYYVGSTIISILTASLRFYKFTCSRVGDNINIKYGFLTLKSYTLPVRNIHAVIVKQNLFRQITGYCSVEGVSIGYGDAENEVALLFPIVKKKLLGNILAEILPEYDIVTEKKGSPARALLFFVLPPLFIWTAFCAGVTAGISYAVKEDILLIALCIWGFISFFILLGRILNFAHTAIGYSERSISMISGGFTRTESILRRDSVQSVMKLNGIVKRLFRLNNYVVDYHAPLLKSSVMVSNLGNEHFEKIAKLIED